MLLILTNKQEAGPKTMEFLRAIRCSLEENSIPFSISSLEETEVILDKSGATLLIAGKPLETWTTIYPRKTAGFHGIAYMIARIAEQKNICFIDKFHGFKKADISKVIQMFTFSLSGVPIPKTYYSPLYTEQHLTNATHILKFPIVVKETNTSQGEGVFLANDENELQHIVRERKERNTDNKKTVFLQEFIPNTFEYRILVLGKKIAVAEKKIRVTKDEFRNNVHLGAKEEFLNPSLVPASVSEAAIAAAVATGIDVAGIDVVVSPDGTPAVFEANSCPAFTLDRKISPEIDCLVKYLTLCERK